MTAAAARAEWQARRLAEGRPADRDDHYLDPLRPPAWPRRPRPLDLIAGDCVRLADERRREGRWADMVLWYRLALAAWGGVGHAGRRRDSAALQRWLAGADPAKARAWVRRVLEAGP